MDTKRVALMGGLLVLAGGMFFMIKNMEAAPVQAPIVQKVQEIPMSHVLVANVTVGYGQRLGEDTLSWKKWPTEAVSEVFIDQDSWPSAVEDLTGALSRFELAAGEPVTERKIVKQGEGGVMSALLKPGHRAVSFRITTDAASSGFILPGDYVDIIMTRRLELDARNSNTGRDENVTFADTIFENVLVLAIDQAIGQGEDAPTSIRGSMVAVELSQEDAELLTVAQVTGDLSLTLRPMEASSRASIPSKANSGALSNDGVSEEQEQTASLTLFRGGETDTVALRGN